MRSVDVLLLDMIQYPTITSPGAVAWREGERRNGEKSGNKSAIAKQLRTHLSTTTPTEKRKSTACHWPSACSRWGQLGSLDWLHLAPFSNSLGKGPARAS